MKPPNILVQTSSLDEFESTKVVLKSVLLSNTYTIYQITKENICRQPWVESCALFIASSCEVTSSQELMLQKFVTNLQGRILFHGISSEDIRKIDHLFAGSELTRDTSKTNPNIEIYQNEHVKTVGVIMREKLVNTPYHDVLSLLTELNINVRNTDHYDTPKSPGYLFTLKPNVKVEELFRVTSNNTTQTVAAKHLQLHFVAKLNKEVLEGSKSSELYVITDDRCNCSFDWKVYQDTLKTQELGNNLVYTDVIESTQNIFTQLNVATIKANGLVVHAKQQTKGKGRSGNQWLSPIGCMMFSMQIDIPLKSELGQKLPFVQHIAVVAFVKSIIERVGYENLELNIKWPNDVYMKKNIKIGGVIVNSSLFNDQFKVVIGLGVNVSNAIPTDCLNSLIKEYNIRNRKMLSELCVEEVLAGTLNEIENLISIFQHQGMEAFKEIYYRYWLHSNTEVILECRDNQKATVAGLDNFGYLLVKLADNTEFSLQPDGNSFDMMRNMIVMKNK